MTEIVIASLMWGVTICIAVSRDRVADRCVLMSAGLVALSLAFNIDSLYLWIDRFLGGRNLLELVSDLALIAGISFLLRGLLRGTIGRHRRAEWLQTAGLLIGAAVLSILFAGIDAPTSSTTFMLSYGTQPAAAAYSVAQFVYAATAMSIMGVICIRHIREMTQPALRLSFILICCGSGCAVLLSLCIIGMDLSHLSGRGAVLHLLAEFYQPLYVAAIALLSIGHSIPPVVRRLQTRRRARDVRVLVEQTTLVWRATVDPDQTIPIERYHRGLFGWPLREPEDELLLHRMVVEIRDATASGREPLTKSGARVVGIAEDFLMTAQGTVANS